jgi:protein-disulfide isomerase
MFMKSIKFILFAFGLFVSLAANAEPEVNALFHQANDPIAGNPKGKITVVEFFDYQCSHCVSMAGVMASIMKDNPNVRIVFKEYPIRGPMSEFASRAALAANKQGKYYELSHALLTTNLALNENNIFDIAKSLGLNVSKMKTDMNSKSVKGQIYSNYNLARKLNINGTPAFFIGKTNTKDSKNLNFVLGEMSQTELQDAINKASS